MDRIRDLCDLARDVDESVESLIRFGASGELAIYVIAHDWPVRSKNDAENIIREPVFLVAEDLHQSLNAECTTVSRVKRRIDDDPIMLLEPVDVARGAHYVTAEEAERFSNEHALTLRSSAEVPPYLNANHKSYSTELAIAVKAWMALFADGSFEPGNRTPRQKIVRWLRASKFGLETNAEQRIATLVNPDPAKVGGAPRTLTK